MSIRINKFLAHRMGISRRQADELIVAGRVTLDNTTAELGMHVGDHTLVALDGRAITTPHTYTYILLHKPVHYVCSRRRQGTTPTIYELLPPTYRRLKPVGRLDKDSSGLLLLTDDGDYAHHMIHPTFHKTKIYDVELDQPLTPLHQQMISDYGVTLPDGISTFLITRNDTQPTIYTVTMHEGRNRQIRRTFAALGYTVTRLHRTHFGHYALDDLRIGTYRLIDRV